ncbi:1-acyl-sn-glycerol-3-phosphate acyltransferase, partial [Mycobacteroides chelonae]|uniref:1-acyl-sn-glycerol-3-phosphate acyltransferase n=1 Tax=Mycobacteroides chelonae TaxID=1774 RepID=UPI003B27F092
EAKVVSLHADPGPGAAQRRAEAYRRHPAVLANSDRRASLAENNAVVLEIDAARRGAPATHDTVEEPHNAAWVAAAADFLRRRLTGDYTVDEFGFDPHLNDAIVIPLLRTLFTSWFRVEVTGIENLPATGAALVVANHAGVLPFDALMASVAVHDTHPAH